MAATQHKNPRAILVSIALVILGIIGIGWLYLPYYTDSQPELQERRQELRQDWLRLHTVSDDGVFGGLEAQWRAVDLPQIEAYIQTEGREKLTRDYAGITALHLAVRYNTEPAIITALITAGADVRSKDYIFDHTPLHVAAWHNTNPAIIDTLIEAGADVRAKDELDNTPLHVAAWRNSNPAIIDTLVKAGADVQAKDKLGHTPLHVAAWYNSSPAIIDALVKAGADLQTEDDLGHTPLDVLSENNQMTANDKARARPILTPWYLSAFNRLKTIIGVSDTY